MVLICKTEKFYKILSKLSILPLIRMIKTTMVKRKASVRIQELLRDPLSITQRLKQETKNM